MAGKPPLLSQSSLPRGACRGFLDGRWGPACCGHPSMRVDTAMAESAAPVIAAALGWQ